MLSAQAQTSGTIAECDHAGCGHSCCEFAEGNFIVLYPGELEAARGAGYSLSHLQLAASPHGGHRAICTAENKRDCDRGYKPLDCASYPFFPTVDSNGQVAADLKGGKCPLRTASLSAHRRWVIATWSQLASAVPRILEWIDRTQLVGYVPVTATDRRDSDEE